VGIPFGEGERFDRRCVRVVICADIWMRLMVSHWQMRICRNAIGYDGGQYYASCELQRGH
jgi:hypothetical protein